MRPSLKLYPVAIMQDRYGGVYCGGNWIAIANFEDGGDSVDRFYEIYNGAHDCDTDAMFFWQKYKEKKWVAVGETPDEALKNLELKNAGTNTGG